MTSQDADPAASDFAVPDPDASDLDDLPELDDDLVPLAPITPWQSVGAGVVFGGAGVVGLGLLGWAFAVRGLSTDGWILVAFAALLVGFGVVVTRTGRRAYLALTDDTVRAHYRTSLVGLWSLSAAAIAGGIAAADPVLVFMAVAVAQIPVTRYASRTTDGGEADRVMRILRPWMLAQWAVTLLGPLAIVAVLGLIGAPHPVESRYERLAATVPVLAAGGLAGFLSLLWQSRRRRRSTRAFIRNRDRL